MIICFLHFLFCQFVAYIIIILSCFWSRTILTSPNAIFSQIYDFFRLLLLFMCSFHYNFFPFYFFVSSSTGLRKVYPYYFTFTTFTKGRWVGEKILDVFAREFRAHPAEEYERCIKAGTLTVNYEKVPIDCRLKHNDLLANIVHRYVIACGIYCVHLLFIFWFQ